MADPSDSAANFEAVHESARAFAPDRYVAALFAPQAVRDDLIALAAFGGEIERIGRQVKEAPLGEIRIAWWRDALLAGGEGGLTGNPTFDAFIRVAKRYRLDPRAIENYLDAHARALFPDPPADDAALDESLRVIDGTPFRFGVQILGRSLGMSIGEDARGVFDAAARAAGLTRIGLELPYALQHGRLPLPAARSPNPFVDAQDWRPQIAWLGAEAARSLADVRRHLAGKPKELTTALLPLALVEPYFRALQKDGHAPDRDIVEIAPLTRLWRIARARWTGRL